MTDIPHCHVHTSDLLRGDLVAYDNRVMEVCDVKKCEHGIGYEISLCVPGESDSEQLKVGAFSMRLVKSAEVP